MSKINQMYSARSLLTVPQIAQNCKRKEHGRAAAPSLVHSGIYTLCGETKDTAMLTLHRSLILSVDALKRKRGRIRSMFSLAGTRHGSFLIASVKRSSEGSRKLTQKLRRFCARPSCPFPASFQSPSHIDMRADRRISFHSVCSESGGLWGRSETNKKHVRAVRTSCSSNTNGSSSSSSKYPRKRKDNNNDGGDDDDDDSTSWSRRFVFAGKITLGLALACTANAALSEIFRRCEVAFPPGIAGMVVSSRIAPSATKSLERFLAPTLQFVSLHLAMLFGPALVMLPTIDFGGGDEGEGGGRGGGAKAMRLMAVIALGFGGSFVSTVFISRFFLYISRSINGRRWMETTLPYWCLLGALGFPMAARNPTDAVACFPYLLALTGGGFSAGFLLPTILRVFLPPVATCMVATWAGVAVLSGVDGKTSETKILTNAYLPARAKESRESSKHHLPNLLATKGVSHRFPT
eukprot:jgi/Bigna1/79106/fgenesh1_pg.59_\